MTENYICNNIELTWTDREKDGVDPSNGYHHALLSFFKKVENNRSTYTLVKTTYEQYDYPTITPDKMIAITTVKELENMDSIETTLTSIVSEIFKNRETRKINVTYVSPSTREKHTQILLRDTDLTWNYSSLCGDIGELPLKTTLKNYSEFIMSLFTSDSIKSAMNGLQGLSKTVQDILGYLKK
jgi:hypothetical protein